MACLAAASKAGSASYLAEKAERIGTTGSVAKVGSIEKDIESGKKERSVKSETAGKAEEDKQRRSRNGINC
jgi:hypothetical protein